MKKYLLIPMAALLLIWATAMTGCSDSTEPETTGGVGSIRVSMIDAPGAYDEVNVEVIRVEVHRGDHPLLATERGLPGLFAVATDRPGGHSVEVPQLHLDDVAALAKLLEERLGLVPGEIAG